MKILITGGNTEIPIDKVRCISNIFHGRTSVDIASDAGLRGHDVTLVGNSGMKSMNPGFPGKNIRFVQYRTYDELESAMKQEIVSWKPDAVVHSAAVSDYKVSGIYAPADSSASYGGINTIEGLNLEPISSTGKVSSVYEELFIRLTPTEKIVDKIRYPWGFKGVLVKFKLQVGMTDDELNEVARNSMLASSADMIVANCLEWAKKRAYIIGRTYGTEVKREHLASSLMDAVEAEGASR